MHAGNSSYGREVLNTSSDGWQQQDAAARAFSMHQGSSSCQRAPQHVTAVISALWQHIQQQRAGHPPGAAVLALTACTCMLLLLCLQISQDGAATRQAQEAGQAQEAL
jgi:hypothetical protein